MWAISLLLVHLQTIRLVNGSILNLRAAQTYAGTTAAGLAQNSGCQLVGEALAICCSLTPDFPDLSASEQAPCLCYSRSIWNPSLFDNAVESCASYASTSIPSAYAPMAKLEGFCSRVGNSNYLATLPRVSATTTSAAITSTSATFSDPACGLVSSAIDACTQLTPGFSRMNATDQALCLCYVSTSYWEPSRFDNAASTCAQVAQTAASYLYLQYSKLEGFCSGVGNILSRPSVVASTTTNPHNTPQDSKTNGYTTTTEASRVATNTGGDFTSIISPTDTGGAPGKSEGEITRASKQEVILLSFVCAAVLLFL